MSYELAFFVPTAATYQLLLVINSRIKIGLAISALGDDEARNRFYKELLVQTQFPISFLDVMGQLALSWCGGGVRGRDRL
jgi:hypothetical protein